MEKEAIAEENAAFFNHRNLEDTTAVVSENITCDNDDQAPLLNHDCGVGTLGGLLSKEVGCQTPEDEPAPSNHTELIEAGASGCQKKSGQTSSQTHPKTSEPATESERVQLMPNKSTPNTPTHLQPAKRKPQIRRYPWRYKKQRCLGRLLVLVGSCIIFFIMFQIHLGKEFHDDQNPLDSFNAFDCKSGKDLCGPNQTEPSLTFGEKYFSMARQQAWSRIPRQAVHQDNRTTHHPLNVMRIKNKTVAKNDEPMACTATHNFPDDPFLRYENDKKPLVAIHLFIALYMFCAIAAVCDLYFVPSLEHICEDLGLQADVAGATFMAGASSAPELCTSIIGVFLAKSDVGLGTIVGSSIFNLLGIIGACAIFAGMPIALSWYPLSRDSLFYTISIIEMIGFMQDKMIQLLEAVIMVATYGLYILWMVFNPRIERWAKDLINKPASRLSGTISIERERSSTAIQDKRNSIRLGMLEARRYSRIAGYGGESNPMRKSMADLSGFQDEIPLKLTPSGLKELDRMGLTPGEVAPHMDDIIEQREEMGISEYEDPFEWPESHIARIYYIFVFPITVLHAFTIPDSRLVGTWQGRLYLLSFILCVVYIALYSYIMVWVSSLAGSYMGIPSTVVGLTILAAGTSVPDMLSSIFVAKDGYGDMAVSNAIGSNVFDILMGLGIPWVIDSIISQHHGAPIDSAGMIYASITLIATIIFLWVSLKLNHWTLTIPYGILTIVVYFIAISICIMMEMNIFFDLNPSGC